MGLKFGMYAGGWKAQCCHKATLGGNDTSWKHWDTDVAMFMAWKIDYLKSDPCCGMGKKQIPHASEIYNEYNHQWDDAFRRAGYLDSVFIQGSGPGRGTNISTFPILLNSWRTTDDVQPNFDSVLRNIHDNDQYAHLAGPGSWVSSSANVSAPCNTKYNTRCELN
jgi:alpha-galactosidase